MEYGGEREGFEVCCRINQSGMQWKEKGRAFQKISEVSDTRVFHKNGSRKIENSF